MQDLLPTAERIAAMLTARGDRLAVSESSAGGLVSASLLAVPGASAYFVAGAITYTGQARETLLGLDAAATAGMRSASPPYAMLLARTLRTRFDTAWALAETGTAGPSGNRYGDAAGQSCLAVSGPIEQAFTLRTGQSSRTYNMRAFAAAALDLLAAALDEAPRS